MGTKLKLGKFDCYDKAADDQPMFVLLAGDPDAPSTVEEWARRRTRRLAAEITAGTVGDEVITRTIKKIAEALQCALAMREWQPHQPQAPIELLRPFAPFPEPTFRNLEPECNPALCDCKSAFQCPRERYRRGSGEGSVKGAPDNWPAFDPNATEPAGDVNV